MLRKEKSEKSLEDWRFLLIFEVKTSKIGCIPEIKIK